MTTIVVTGASAGIGKATAEALAAHSWPSPLTLALTGRNHERTTGCAEDLERRFGVRCVALLADFSSLESVAKLADDLLARFETIDRLINNAGLWHQDRKTSKEGFEDTFAVNHLAPFSLTLRLLPAILRSEEARIVNVSSRLHRDVGPFDFSDIDTERKTYKGLQVYGRSKLANVLFTFELARRLRDSPHVTASAVHPGSVNTVIVRDNRFLSWGIKVAAPFLKTAAEGAATSVHVATSEALKGVSAGYYADCIERAASIHAYDQRAARRLWDLSLERVGLVDSNLPLASVQN